jgi:hypothetical protein
VDYRRRVIRGGYSSISSWPDLFRSSSIETIMETAVLPHCYQTMKGTDKAGKGC